MLLQTPDIAWAFAATNTAATTTPHTQPFPPPSLTMDCYPRRPRTPKKAALGMGSRMGLTKSLSGWYYDDEEARGVGPHFRSLRSNRRRQNKSPSRSSGPGSPATAAASPASPSFPSSLFPALSASPPQWHASPQRHPHRGRSGRGQWRASLAPLPMAAATTMEAATTMAAVVPAHREAGAAAPRRSSSATHSNRSNSNNSNRNSRNRNRNGGISPAQQQQPLPRHTAVGPGASEV